MHAIHSIPRPAPPTHPVLTRELLATHDGAALMFRDELGARLLSKIEREASLASFMKARPAGDLWIFGYGSLIWNPALKTAARRDARTCGWHRSFCLSMIVGRGAPGRPGLALGLDRDGFCDGVAYRIAEQDVASELPILWRREMLAGGYNPRWVEVLDESGEKFGSAITFTIDRNHENYAGDLSLQEKIQRLATAAGSWGSSADYLFRTIDSLRERGIRDEEIERLGDLVGDVLFELKLDKAA